MNGESSGAAAGVDGTDLLAELEMLERELLGALEPSSPADLRLFLFRLNNLLLPLPLGARALPLRLLPSLSTASEMRRRWRLEDRSS